MTDVLKPDDGPSFVSDWVKNDSPNNQIGKREHPLVLTKYGGEYRSIKAEALIADIVGRLVAVSDDKNQLYRITILDTPKVNAFALPGGYLYITRGLLALANDSAELAGVIAHEMAHVSANHGILRNKKKQSVDVGSQVAEEVLGNSVAGQVAKAANQIRLADFSKDQELQADVIGIRMLGRAGFDPHAVSRFLLTMQAYQSLMSKTDGRFGEASFLSSHPTTPKRIELAKRHARAFGAPGIGKNGREAYLKGIDGLVFGDSVEEGFVRNNTFSHPSLGITFSAPATHRMENKATAVVITGPNQLATRFDAAVLPSGKSLPAYLKNGWVNGLDERSIKSKMINGLPAASASAEGDQWEFAVRVIQLDRQVYRFITAAPKSSGRAMGESEKIADTFRKLSKSETDLLSPLRIKIIQVAQNDSLASLTKQMMGVPSKLRSFQVLNGLTAGELPSPGDYVKIVTE